MPGFLVIIALLALIPIILAILDWFKKKEQIGQEAPVTFPNANVRLDAPFGFATALDFEGFGLPESKASVMVLRLDGPYSQIADGFTEEALRSQGMTLLSKEVQQVGTLPGLLLNVRQNVSDTTFEKWLLVFGDQDDVHLVTAAYPQWQAAHFSRKLRTTVLSARRLQEGPASGSTPAAFLPVETRETTPFRVETGTDLTLAREMGKMQAFTRDGIFPIQAPTDVLFIVAPSLGAVSVGDRNQYARNRVQQIEQVRGVTITAQSPVRVDDMDGVEIVARGNDIQTGTPLTIYQTMLFDAQGYYLMQGLVGLDDTGIYLPVFKTVIRTFRRTVTR